MWFHPLWLPALILTVTSPLWLPHWRSILIVIAVIIGWQFLPG